jgi:hypothetical protein
VEINQSLGTSSRPTVEGDSGRGWKGHVMNEEIKTGDKIYFHRPNPHHTRGDGLDKYNYRTVRAVTLHGLKIYHMGLLIVIPLVDVRGIKSKNRTHGKNELSQLMFLHGIRNEDVAEKSGYAVTTVDRARNHREGASKVKPRTLSDLMDTVKQLAEAA